MRLVRDPYGALVEMHAAYGNVFAVGRGPLRFVYLAGAEAHRDLFALGPPDVSWHDAFAVLIPVDGETAIVVSDGADHARRRRIVQPAFGRRRLDDTITVMSDEARRTFATWTAGTTHHAYGELRPCIRRIVIRSLFGDDFAARGDELGEALEPAFEYINRPPWKRFDRDWPGTPYRRAMRSRRAADAIVFDEILRRRQDAETITRDDLLSVLIVAQDHDGALSDVEVRDQVISLIAAGYDTTTAAASWMTLFLATNDDVRQRLVDEVASIVGDRPLDAGVIADMPWLNGVVSETLRLGPPGYVVPRKIDRPVTVAGHTLPAGKLAFYSPYLTGRMASLWPAADEFRPGRWIEGHEHHHDVEQGAWAPFGGGTRRCLGFGFAITELKVLAVELLRATHGRITALNPTPEPAGLASMYPADGVPIRVGSPAELVGAAG